MSKEVVPPASSAGDDSSVVSRRTFVSTSAEVAMVGGLVASYGTFVIWAGRFLYDADEDAKGLQFLAAVDDLRVGESLTYVTPTGGKVVVARQSEGTTADDFIALSSVCPHLGCKVHWEGQNNRFFCPCHNGVFDPQGNPLEGPPAAANQQLPRYPLTVENGLLFIEVEQKSLTET